MKKQPLLRQLIGEIEEESNRMKRQTLRDQLFGESKEEYALSVFGYLFLFAAVFVACFADFSVVWSVVCVASGLFVFFFAMWWRDVFFLNKTGKDVSQYPALFCKSPAQAVAAVCSSFVRFFKTRKHVVATVVGVLILATIAAVSILTFVAYAFAWIFFLVCACAAIGCVLKLF